MDFFIFFFRKKEKIIVNMLVESNSSLFLWISSFLFLSVSLKPTESPRTHILWINLHNSFHFSYTLGPFNLPLSLLLLVCGCHRRCCRYRYRHRHHRRCCCYRHRHFFFFTRLSARTNKCYSSFTSLSVKISYGILVLCERQKINILLKIRNNTQYMYVRTNERIHTTYTRLHDTFYILYKFRIHFSTFSSTKKRQIQ